MVAVLVLAAAFGGAAVVYGHRVAAGFHGCPPNAPISCAPGAIYVRPGWVAPTALGIAVVGIALALGVVTTARRNPN